MPVAPACAVNPACMACALLCAVPHVDWRSSMRALSRLGMDCVIILVVLMSGCSGGGTSALGPDGGGADATIAPASRFSSLALVGAGSVMDAVAVPRAGQRPLVIVVSLTTGGLAAFTAGASGDLMPAS